MNIEADGVEPTQAEYISVVWWCQRSDARPAPRAPGTMCSANAQAVNNRPRLSSTLPRYCTHWYFLSTHPLCLQLWNIGQWDRPRFPVSGLWQKDEASCTDMMWAGSRAHGHMWTQTHSSVHTVASSIRISIPHLWLLLNTWRVTLTTATESSSYTCVPFCSCPLLHAVSCRRWSFTVVCCDIRHHYTIHLNNVLEFTEQQTFNKQWLLIPPCWCSPLLPVPITKPPSMTFVLILLLWYAD